MTIICSESAEELGHLFKGRVERQMQNVFPTKSRNILTKAKKAIKRKLEAKKALRHTR